jgi:3'-phosphoadenosine 5'-phosphosulfate sulfotransferase (PAPS reductase)/FAD synthetase
MHKYIRTLGWEDWDQMIGIRADEMRRVTKIRARGRSSESSHETMVMPLADAGVTLSDVNAFWERAPFNLKLTTYLGRTMAGNCDLCFLKPGKQVLSLIRERPARADWWAAQEAAVQSTGTFTGDGARFRNDRPSYAQMKKFSLQQDDLFADDEEGIPCFCGE